RQVRCVASVGHRENVRRRLHTTRGGFRQQRVQRDSLPDRVELGPFRDAMNVGVHSLMRQRLELVPRPTCCWSVRAAEQEVPGRERRPRRGTGREHGEVGRLVLAGGAPGGGWPGSSAATKSWGDKWLGHGLVNASFWCCDLQCSCGLES